MDLLIKIVIVLLCIPVAGAFIFLFEAPFAWVLMKVLAATGNPLSFWPCFGIVFLCFAIFGGGRAASSSNKS